MNKNVVLLNCCCFSANYFNEKYLQKQKKNLERFAFLFLAHLTYQFLRYTSKRFYDVYRLMTFYLFFIDLTALATFPQKKKNLFQAKRFVQNKTSISVKCVEIFSISKIFAMFLTFINLLTNIRSKRVKYTSVA